MDELREYIKSLNSDERAEFEAFIGTSIGYLRKAISAGQKLGSGLVVRIEQFSKRRVTCEQLRPDVDWAYLRRRRAA